MKRRLSPKIWLPALLCAAAALPARQAAVALVFARTPGNGVGAFLVEPSAPGWSPKAWTGKSTAFGGKALMRSRAALLFSSPFTPSA